MPKAFFYIVEQFSSGKVWNSCIKLFLYKQREITYNDIEEKTLHVFDCV